MNALRYLYLVPLYIFCAGLALGWLSLICVPFVLRWIERRSEETNKKLETLRAEREALLTNFIVNLRYQDYSDLSKRAN